MHLAYKDATMARAIVLLIYLACFASTLMIVGIAIMLHGDKLKAVDFEVAVVDAFAVPLSIVIAGVAATAVRAPVEIAPAQIVLLYGSTAIWNGFALVIAAALLLSEFQPAHVHLMNPEQFHEFMGFVKDKLTFIVSGILTYVYAVRS